jgi:hypothetical protein
MGPKRELIHRLSADLTRRFGRGFGQRNVFQVRAFCLAYRGEFCRQDLQNAEARGAEKVRMVLHSLARSRTTSAPKEARQLSRCPGPTTFGVFR